MLVVLAGASGCGSILFRNPLPVTVDSDVPGSSVTVVNEGKGGTTPCEVLLDRKKNHLLVIKSKGQEQAVKVTSHVSWWRAAISIILNGFISTPTFWIATPFLCGIDIDAGAWHRLKPDDITSQTTSGPSEAEAPPTPAPAPSGPPETSADAKPFCTSCGARLEPGKRFCTQCGARR